MDYKQKYAQWLEDDYFDAETKKKTSINFR